jgi:hypothetical protein
VKATCRAEPEENKDGQKVQALSTSRPLESAQVPTPVIPLAYSSGHISTLRAHSQP